MNLLLESLDLLEVMVKLGLREEQVFLNEFLLGSLKVSVDLAEGGRHFGRDVLVLRKVGPLKGLIELLNHHVSLDDVLEELHVEWEVLKGLIEDDAQDRLEALCLAILELHDQSWGDVGEAALCEYDLQCLPVKELFERPLRIVLHVHDDLEELQKEAILTLLQRSFEILLGTELVSIAVSQLDEQFVVLLQESGKLMVHVVVAVPELEAHTRNQSRFLLIEVHIESLGELHSRDDDRSG